MAAGGRNCVSFHSLKGGDGKSRYGVLGVASPSGQNNTFYFSRLKKAIPFYLED
jgi:hypothetical protein